MKKNQFLKESDVTAESVFFMKRRQVLKALGISAAALSLPHAAHADLLSWFKGNDRPPAPAGKPLEFSKPAAWQNNLPLTPADKVSGYNNFYEFGLDKADPAANAGSLKTDPWTLKISGEVAKPLTLDHDDLTRRFPLEERIYRMRCVEAWSMVVPWIGFPLHKLLALAEPTSNAKYVAFETIYAPETDAWPAGPLYRRRAEISLCRRIASRRSNASAHTDDRGCLWQGVTATKWRAGTTDCAVEIWL